MTDRPDVEALIRDSVRRHQEFVNSLLALAMPDHKCNPQERFVCSELLLATRLEAAIRGLRNLRRMAQAKDAEPLTALVSASSVARQYGLLLREIGVIDE